MAVKVHPRWKAFSRQYFVRGLTAVVSLGVLLQLGPQVFAADSAAKIYEEARKAERAGQMVQAYVLYSQAAALEPDNQFYGLKAQAMQARAALESPPKPPAATTLGGAIHVDFSAFDSITAKDLSSARQLLPPIKLQPGPGRKDFDLRGDAKSLWEEVAKAYALDCVFDGDYPAGGPRLHFELTNVDYRDALHGLEAATRSFVVPVSRRLVLVVQDTEPKRRDVEPMETVVIAVPQATTTQELQEIAQAVRQLFALEHLAFDAQENQIVMRGRNSLVEPARLLFQELLRHRPQVSLEVRIIEVDLSSTLAYGLDYLPTIPVHYLGTFWNNPLSLVAAALASGIPGGAGLLTFGGGQSMFGIAIGSATLMAQMTDDRTHTLLRSELRAVDGTPSTLHVGNRLPVLTSGYFGPASFSQGGQVFMPPPSFTFEDLGVNLKVTPHINGMEEVTLELESEFKEVTGQSLNGIPIISTRKLTTKVRLGENESAIVGGLLTSNEARSISGLAGVSEVPGLGALFRQTNKNLQTSEVLLVVKPTLLDLPPDQFTAPAIYTGSELRPLTPL